MNVRPEGPKGPNQLVRSRDLDWRPLAEPGVTGISVKVLRFDAGAGRAPTILLKFEPGSSYPMHNHPGGEEIYVLEGEARLGKDHLRAGDYLYTAPGQVCVPQEVEILRRESRGNM